MQTRIITNSLSPRRQWLLRSAAALLAAAVIAAIPGRAHAGVFVSVRVAPPPLPVYVQPPIPGPGYIWTPGYWAWGDGGYYWVPGAWVLAPFVGALWTPGYWGWSGGVYIFHAGYWGRHVGFYGGINYGYGYGGHGYDGGYWRGGGFYYNRSVNHVTNNITHVYSRTVINRGNIGNRISYNGGPHGIAARATPQQQAWARGGRQAPHAATAAQRNGALRSAGYAPHANAPMQSGGGTRYSPSAAGNGYRGAPNRPQSYQARSYQTRGQPQAYRPAPQRYAQPAYRPANPRQAQYQHAAAPRGQGGGHQERRGDRQH
ncbi:YXWGXW repeat-containing protein [Rhodanobacter geophilus]|uniref:YXWGXW repeat-containing protein n=1 Tax=Rhodanobacter geophilus TaxID=3162488 RepID=A0ABV3QQV9_9GAMM